MSEMTFEKQECSKCHKIEFCAYAQQKTKMVWLCNFCFGWSMEYRAELKDEITKILIECGIEDLE